MPTIRFTYSGAERVVENPSLIKPGQICGLEVMKGGTALEQVKRYWSHKIEGQVDLVEFPGIGVPGPAAPSTSADRASAEGAPVGDSAIIHAPGMPTLPGSPAVTALTGEEE